MPRLLSSPTTKWHLPVIVVCEKRGLKVGKDILITGFDNCPIASTNQPGITTIDPHSSDLAWEATSLILSRLEEPETALSEYPVYSLR